MWMGIGKQVGVKGGEWLWGEEERECVEGWFFGV